MMVQFFGDIFFLKVARRLTKKNMNDVIFSKEDYSFASTSAANSLSERLKNWAIL